MGDHTELTDRFDWMRNSGICSPTTRGLLDDAQAALEQTVKERDELRSILSRDHAPDPHDAEWWRRSAAFWAGEAEREEQRAEKAEAALEGSEQSRLAGEQKLAAVQAERDALADRIERAKAALNRADTDFDNGAPWDRAVEDALSNVVRILSEGESS